MKIALSTAPGDSHASTYVRVACIEKGVESLIKEGKTLTLELPADKPGTMTPRVFRILVRSLVHAAKKYKLEKIVWDFDCAKYPKLHKHGSGWVYSTIAENLLLADYEFVMYKSSKPKQTLKEIVIAGKTDKEARQGFERGMVVAEAVNATREIANVSGSDMTPKHLAEAAKTALKGTKTSISVLDESAIKKLKMGGLLGVGRGAKERPRFIVIEYWGGGKQKGSTSTKKRGGPIVFVGKGITFDTGGLQVKPGMSMYEMHLDMSGGAAVIGAIRAIAKLGLKQNVVGLIPAAENAISDEAIRPGDVLTMMSGKTVEVLHTDAEGRLILADALHYARKYEPRLVVDVATLTGAALVAVGQHANVIMTKDRGLEDALRDLGEQSGDYVFPLPLWNEYKQYTKGTHGDISNVPAGDSRYGGSINGGMFLSHFTKGLKWVHIDIAPRMTSVGSDKLAKGAAGEPVRLMVAIVENL